MIVDICVPSAFQNEMCVIVTAEGNTNYVWLLASSFKLKGNFDNIENGSIRLENINEDDVLQAISMTSRFHDHVKETDLVDGIFDTVLDDDTVLRFQR